MENKNPFFDMRNSIQSILFFGATILLNACGQSPQIGSPAHSQNYRPDEKIIVERMYATSISPSGNSGIENLFDADPSTKWRLAEGAGEGEGLMIYFEEPTYISKIALDGEANIGRIQYFVDGENAGSANPNALRVIGKQANSLFVKIASLHDENRQSYFINTGEGQVIIPGPSKDLAFSALRILGENDRPLAIQPLKQVSGSVRASTSLSPASAYNAAYLFDSRRDFGWAEGDAGSGEGQSLSFNFDREVQISKLKIWNGYQRSDQHFSSNGRLKSFSFGKKGESSSNLTANDSQNPGIITLPNPLKGQSFELKIQSIYPGASYKDLVISELRFFDGENWFGVQTNIQAEMNKQILQKTKGTSLASVLDKNLHDEWYVSNPQGYARNQSRDLLLRSDGTFVLYLLSNDYSEKQKVEISQVADGNWELQTADSRSSKLKIFGKLHRIQDKEKYYVGKTNEDVTKIFKEILTIENDMVKGEKLVDSIHIKIRPSDFVNCSKYAEVAEDLRYKSDDNFMKMVLYSDCQACILREQTALALARAQSILDKEAAGKGYQLLIWDAYRPYSVQKLMWEKIKDARYVADPYNGGSSHNKGTAVDITITEKGNLNGIPMGTAHDHFGEEAHWSYKNLTAEELANRTLLKKVMEGAGFKSLDSEWWHWSLKDFAFPIADIDAGSCAP